MANVVAGPQVDLHRTLGDRLSILFIAALMVGASGVMAVGAVATVTHSLGLFLFMVLIAVMNAGLTWIVIREAIMRWSTHIVLHDRSVRLRLPARRGYVATAPVDLELPLSAIKAVESRDEAFRSVGNTVIQQSYVLVKDDGQSLFLGADRPWVTPFFGGAAAAIAARAGLAIRDKGTVRGEPGFILLWGQTVPAWDAPPLPPADSDRLAYQSSRALYWVWVIVSISLLIGAISRVASN
jgi:hypothetical protein